MYRRGKQDLYWGQPLWFWGVTLVLLFCVVWYVSAWFSAAKVAGKYRWVKEERPTGSATEDEKAYTIRNLGKDKKPKGKLKIELGLFSSTLKLYRPDGSLFKVFKGWRPFPYSADLTEIDPQTGAYMLDSRGYTWGYEYIRIINGYPNVKIHYYDSEGQIRRSWLYTEDAPIVEKILSGVTPGVKRERPYTSSDPGMVS